MSFEDAVFTALKGSTFKKKRYACPVQDSVEELVLEECMNLSKLSKKSSIRKVSNTEFQIAFEESVFASELMSSLSQENPAKEFVFSNDYLNFTPDEALIKKSKVPLWVISPDNKNNTSVTIKRVYN